MTVTQKGQVTIPKKIRDLLGISENDKVEFIINRKNIILKSKKDILDLAGKYTQKDPNLPAKARDSLEKNYERF